MSRTKIETDELHYECAKSRFCPDEWVVEAIDYGNEGVIYAATFSGPDADARAAEYAAWQNARLAAAGRAAAEGARV